MLMMDNNRIPNQTTKWHPSQGKQKQDVQESDGKTASLFSKDLSECDVDISSAETLALEAEGGSDDRQGRTYLTLPDDDDDDIQHQTSNLIRDVHNSPM